MGRFKIQFAIALALSLMVIPPRPSMAWHDETHIAVAKAAGYVKWYNVAGADMAKIKAGAIEAHNHYASNSRGTVVTPEMVLGQVERYNQIERKGHLYGAIIASLRDYVKEKKKGKYGAYHIAFCAHYVGDLSQPLHNMPYSYSRMKIHHKVDGIIDHEVLDNLHKIKIYPITIHSERDLATEIARIANLAKDLGYRVEDENRLLTKEEAYAQISHSASLFKAILEYLDRIQ